MTNLSPDPYGIDIAFDASGDFVVTSTGDLAPSAGPLNVAQAVALRIKTPIGDLPLHIDYGSSIPSQFVGSKAVPAAIATRLQGELATMVSQDARVVSAVLTGYQSPASTNLGASSSQFEVLVTVIGGTQITLSDVANPQVSDLTAPVPVDPNDPLFTYDLLTTQEFFAGEAEYDTLADLDAVAALVADLPPIQGN